MNVKDRVAIVTGSGQGIGEGIAKALAAAGAKVVVNDLVPERVDEVVAEFTGAGIDSAEFLPEHPAEKTIALQLLRYPAALSATAESLGPHRLCVYLYELAGAFSKFYEQCPVLAAEDERTRASRLRLCQLTARVLADGLEVLGIPTLDRM